MYRKSFLYYVPIISQWRKHVSSYNLTEIVLINVVLEMFNLYHHLDKFGRWKKKILLFLFFSEKKALTLQASCFLRRQFAWNVKAFFSWKKFENIVVWWYFYPVCLPLKDSIKSYLPLIIKIIILLLWSWHKHFVFPCTKKTLFEYSEHMLSVECS